MGKAEMYLEAELHLEVEALRELSPLDVLHVMRRASGLSLQALAQRMGRKFSSVATWFAEAATDKFVPVAQVPALCHALDSALLIEWQRVEFERLQRGEPAATQTGDPGRTVDLLLRGIVQAATAVGHAREAGDNPTPRERRQIHNVVLLAVATLVAAAGEIRTAPATGGAGLSLFQPGQMLLVEEPRPTRRERLAAWWRGLFDVARARRELREARRVMGAMGYVLRDMAERDPGRIPFCHQDTVARLLVEGERLARDEAVHAD